MRLKELESLMQVGIHPFPSCSPIRGSRGKSRLPIAPTYHAICSLSPDHVSDAPLTAPAPPPPQDIAPFAEPKIELEQYPTGPHLAARLLYTVSASLKIFFCTLQAADCPSPASPVPPQVAHSYDEFEGQVVADLGCGTAMLAIGAACLGAAAVIGVDVDADALEVARQNIDEFDDPLPIDLVQSTVQALALQPRLRADVVIMNPPFGTRQKGADMDFLRVAFRVARRSVYSLHKSSTREHIRKVATRELGAASAAVLAQLRYDLPPTYSFHRQKSKDIEVDLWRFEVPEGGSGDAAVGGAAAEGELAAQEALHGAQSGSEDSDSDESEQQQ